MLPLCDSLPEDLLELAQRECEERRRKRIGKLLKESGLPLEKSLANFDGKRLPVKVSRQMKVLFEGDLCGRWCTPHPSSQGASRERR